MTSRVSHVQGYTCPKSVPTSNRDFKVTFLLWHARSAGIKNYIETLRTTLMARPQMALVSFRLGSDDPKTCFKVHDVYDFMFVELWLLCELYIHYNSWCFFCVSVWTFFSERLFELSICTNSRVHYGNGRGCFWIGRVSLDFKSFQKCIFSNQQRISNKCNDLGQYTFMYTCD